MNTALKNILKFTLFLGIGLVILYLVYQKADAAFQEDCQLKNIAPEDCSLISKVIQDFTEANYWWILVTLILYTISNVSRAVRWRMLIKPLGYQPRLINCFWTVVFGYFANLGFPRMGEIMRSGLLAQYEKIEVEKIIGTVVVSRMVDLFSLLIMSALAIGLAFDKIWPFLQENANLDEKLQNGYQLLIYAGIVIAILGLLGYIFRRRIMASKIVQKIKAILLGFWDGLQTIRKVDRPFWFIFHSINIWVLYYLMVYFCFFAYGPTAGLSAIAGLVIFVMGGWGMVVPSPGGMGSYHFLAQTGLSMYGVSWDDGFSFANIAFFSIQLGANVFLGILSLIVLPIINKNYKPILPKKKPEDKNNQKAEVTITG